jgi:hypothetical protein
MTEQVHGRILDCVADAVAEAERDGSVEMQPVRVVHRVGPLTEVLRDASAQAQLLAIGQAGRCRHADLAERLREVVDCPVVETPPEALLTAGDLRPAGRDAGP